VSVAIAHSELLEITDANFDEIALRSATPLLVDFTAAWCPPCRAIAPHVEALARAYQGRVQVGTCDVDSNHALAARLDVRSMPTLMVFRGGRMVAQLVGAAPRAKIEALIQRVLV
jgi:thioredoxin 1